MNIRTSQKDYLPEFFDKEVAADIGASILMANDQALKYALSEFRRLDDIANYFIINKSKLRVRIMQYLEFNDNYTYDTSYKLFKYL